jgi:hypothetical protein
MPLVQFKIFAGEDGVPLRKIDIECDFLPRVGDVFNTFDLFDDLKVEGNHFSIVYDIEWWIEGNRAVPTVKLTRYDNQRSDILRRYDWFPRNGR